MRDMYLGNAWARLDRLLGAFRRLPREESHEFMYWADLGDLSRRGKAIALAHARLYGAFKAAGFREDR